MSKDALAAMWSLRPLSRPSSASSLSSALLAGGARTIVRSAPQSVPHAESSRAAVSRDEANSIWAAALSSRESAARIRAMKEKVQRRIWTIESSQRDHEVFKRPSSFASDAAPNPATLQSSPEEQTNLVDSFQREHTYLRISLTERCSFRCVYCMPAEGVQLTPKGHLLTTEEVKRIAKAFVQMGVKKVRLTGGEPLLRKDVAEIVRYLRRDLGVDEVGITTNGLVLDRMLDDLLEAGLTHVNISIDSLQPERFSALTRQTPKTLDRVRAAIDKALQARQNQLSVGDQQPLKVKLNVVVMRGRNESEAKDFVALTKEMDIEVRFIEYMPFASNSWSDSLLVPSSALLSSISSAFSPEAVLRSSDAANDTTRHFSIAGHKGRFGFISSMSDHFCGSCNRVRVMADGNLKVCLFGNKEVSLRDAIRSSTGPEESEMGLKRLISSAINRKHFKHGGMKDPLALWEAAETPLDSSQSSEGHTAAREMSRIGG